MRNNTKLEQAQKFSKRPLASWVKAIALATSAAVPFMANAVMAQEVEEVVVTGTRQVIQDQIAIKRDNVGVVDGLSASDIGELPALSIGEALESITGAASHRENGGATEISIRGLGPYLSATTFNGRVATNGSGDRSVNFSQFPSELMSKLAIHKTQSADMIEGGVAGVIALETLKPLDYGKRRFQLDGKLNVNPDGLDVDNSLQGDIGTRFTGSYVDQFEFDNGMALGWTFGGQISEISQPEAEARSTSPAFAYACLNETDITNEGMFRSASGDCEDQVVGSSNQGYQTAIDPVTGEAINEGDDFVWTGSSRGFRQNETSDERNSFFAGIQFQPNEQWDINFDFQYSKRNQDESRHDLTVDSKRTTVVDGVNLTGLFVNDASLDANGDYVVDAEGNLVQGENAPVNGEIQQWFGDPTVYASGELFNREEIYTGGGLAVTYMPTDVLTLDLDIAYSKTTREETQITNSMRSGTSGSSQRVDTWWVRNNGVPVFAFENFDVTDHNNFQNTLRTRVDFEALRDNVVNSIRFDAEYELEMPFLSSVKGGLRASELTFLQLGGNNDAGSRIESVLNESVVSSQELVDACKIEFPESDFFDRLVDTPLVTNVDSAGNVISSGNSFAAFDNACLSNMILESNGIAAGTVPEGVEEDSATIDVTEKTTAAYVMADYELDNGLRGNFGVRVIKTDVTSVGYRSNYDVIDNGDGSVQITDEVDGDVTRVESGSSYTEVLPSAMFMYDLRDDLVLRGGLFKGLSRQDPRGLSFARVVDTDDDDNILVADADNLTDDEIQNLVTGITANGNPEAQPFTSWNTDLSIEWYPNDDAILAFGVYHKQFTGSTVQSTTQETYTIGGNTTVFDVIVPETTDETSDLYGFEVTGSYRWDIGIGVKVSYNHAETDFEFEDQNYGDGFVDGVQTNIGMLEPASIAGFSEDSFSGQVYYQIGEFDIAAIYKYRSEYFQPYTTNGNLLRYVGDTGVWEARAAWRMNDYIRFKVEAINLFSEPKSQYFYADDNAGEFNDYGPRLFFGVSAKF